MALDVIGVGLGRTGTLSLKFALEHLGFGPCCHMTEVFADARHRIPLWLAASEGAPDWDSIFAGFRSTCDYPSATYWRELAEFYPAAKLILTTRDADRWFDSVSATIFASWMQDAYRGKPAHALMQRTVIEPIGGDVADRGIVTAWFRKREEAILEMFGPDRLLLFDPREGWDPLCAFLGVATPDIPYPRVNTRDQIGNKPEARTTVQSDPALQERLVQHYIAVMREAAFPS